MADITKLVRKYRKLFPSLKVYVCYDPAAWDASKAAKANGVVRVQVSLNDTYDSGIYETKLTPRSDEVIVKTVDSMCRKAIRNRVKSLKKTLTESRGEAKKARGQIVEAQTKAKDLRGQIKSLSGFLNADVAQG